MKSQPTSIRGQYEAHGADGYYRQAGRTYRNPHEPIIERCLDQAAAAWKLDLSHVLDLAAGSGEVTLALRKRGADQIDAIDPYTADAYAARTGAPAEQLGFAEIAAGSLEGRRYSLIVCSFALHLCEPSRLPLLCRRLSTLAPRLLILTPHKRPVILEQWGWALEGEKVIERVRSRIYRSLSA